MNQRRYDIDALRSIAMFLLIFYHLGISFTLIAPQILFVQNKRMSGGVWPLLNIMNNWRIPLVFLIAGVALGFHLAKELRCRYSKREEKSLSYPGYLELLYFQPLLL